MANTSATFPGTIVNDTSVGTVAWSNPTNAEANDASVAIVMSGMSCTETGYGAQLILGGTPTGSKYTSTLDGTLRAGTYGGATDKWGCTLTDTVVNGSTFGVGYQSTGPAGTSNRLKATNFGFAIPSGATIDGVAVVIERQVTGTLPLYNNVDYITVQIYYTEAADAENPTVTITSPTSDSTYSTSSSTITVSGSASDNVGVTSVTWANAGNSTSGTATGTTSWTQGITLAAGSNTITITAHDAATNTGTDTITITYTAGGGGGSTGWLTFLTKQLFLNYDSMGGTKHMISKGAAFTTGFDCVKTDGTADTSTVPTVTISKDGGNFASTTNSAARIQSTNAFSILLTATEMNASMVVLQITGTGLVPRTIVIHPDYFVL